MNSYLFVCLLVAWISIKMCFAVLGLLGYAGNKRLFVCLGRFKVFVFLVGFVFACMSVSSCICVCFLFSSNNCGFIRNRKKR